MANIVYTALLRHGLQDRVMGICADTTASNFGRINGAVYLLQVYHLTPCSFI